MARVEDFQLWFEHEKSSNAKMIGMLASVPEGDRSDGRYRQALDLAGHLSACRENWLSRLSKTGPQVDWWPQQVELEGLAGRYEAMERTWSDYLSKLSDAEIERDFEFDTTVGRWRWNVEGQLVQLVGHAFYHRGQISLLVKQLGGDPVDTDYLYWCFDQQPDRWKKLD